MHWVIRVVTEGTSLLGYKVLLFHTSCFCYLTDLRTLLDLYSQPGLYHLSTCDYGWLVCLFFNKYTQNCFSLFFRILGRTENSLKEIHGMGRGK